MEPIRKIVTMRPWCVLALAAACAAPVRAQTTGTVAGTVVDAAGGDALEAVQVVIPALNLGATSDAGGRFAIPAVPPGAHELRAELIGYDSETMVVTVTAGQTARVELRLAPGTLLLDGLVVTGTAFAESPINLPYSVAVVGRGKMEEQGSPQLVDFFKNLGVSHGVIGERNSWYNSDQAGAIAESVANVNLRGLGASRSLVLFNGRRQVYVPARLIGGRFVDVNTMPSIALDRIEVLKEGASAVYGSDAVAGVANFLTRSSFTGFEAAASRDQFAGAGDTNLGAIWGGGLGGAHAVFAAEWMGRQELLATERDWTLRPFEGGRGGWSSVGNPGLFLTPQLSGGEDAADLIAALNAAQSSLWDDAKGNEQGFLDPRCGAFGGHAESWTCRFRYMPWDNLIEKTHHLRTFAEVNGSLDNGIGYHVEGLWSQATIPDWLTTPSFPPFPFLFNGVLEVAGEHPGRRAFCEQYGGMEEYAAACSSDADWYFRGRPVGNTGPGRTLHRQSRTARLAASVNGDFAGPGGRAAHFDLGLAYSRTAGNTNLPGTYTERLFLAFRGFGGPDCDVGVVPDPAAAAGMALGPLSGQVAGEGDCRYYNPFSNAIERSRQPGSQFETGANPDYAPGLANGAGLMRWLIREESNLESSAGLLVGDATLTGTWIEDVAGYAAGYQFRRFDAAGDPNDSGDVTVNPCPVLGDATCPAQDTFGPFSFTNVHRPYDESQTVHRLFGEIPLNLGARLDLQLAANYEYHEAASSFDPKVAWRYPFSESPTHSLYLRGSVQTTFRTPSLDDVNQSPLTSLEWIKETGIYQAVDKIGNPGLEPERAFTYNAGVVLFTGAGVEATFDYWSYDFENMIGAMPHGEITALYDGESTRSAVKQYILCPDGWGTGTCTASELERVRVDFVNWPGVETSGFDLHLGARLDAGPGHFTAGLDGTYTLEYRTKALMLGDLELQPETEAAGYLNFGNPIATSLPGLKGRAAAAYNWSTCSLTGYLNYISAYEDRGSTVAPDVDPFLTFDLNFLWRLSGRLDVALSALNLTGAEPPFADVELMYDGFTHDPKGRRLKLALSCNFGAGNPL